MPDTGHLDSKNSKPEEIPGRRNDMWEARATYADGTEVCEYFPYREEGNYMAENERQYELEAWLLGYHDDCTWYSVAYVEEF